MTDRPLRADPGADPWGEFGTDALSGNTDTEMRHEGSGQLFLTIHWIE